MFGLTWSSGIGKERQTLGGRTKTSGCFQYWVSWSHNISRAALGPLSITIAVRLSSCIDDTKSLKVIVAIGVSVKSLGMGWRKWTGAKAQVCLCWRGTWSIEWWNRTGMYPRQGNKNMMVMFFRVLSQSMTKSVSAECQLTSCGC